VSIHPTALVSPKAILGENVEIGPFAIVEEGVRIGDDSIIQARAILTDRVTLGARNLVGYGAVIGSAPQDFAHKSSISSEVIIGDDNVIREYVTIHRGTAEGSATRMGNGNMLMAGVHLGHNSSVGNRSVIANNCLLAGYVEVGDDVVLGGGSVFHQFLRIGEMCMIRGGTAWSKDIPPFTVGQIINVVCGINAVGMRRKGISSAERLDVKRAYNLLYRSGLNVEQAIEQSRAITWSAPAERFVQFISHRTKRGLCSSKGRGLANTPDQDESAE
jgi:UDP-N-acetylglucosamine acyltransferase